MWSLISHQYLHEKFNPIWRMTDTWCLWNWHSVSLPWTRATQSDVHRCAFRYECTQSQVHLQSDPVSFIYFVSFHWNRLQSLNQIMQYLSVWIDAESCMGNKVILQNWYGGCIVVIECIRTHPHTHLCLCLVRSSGPFGVLCVLFQ